MKRTFRTFSLLSIFALLGIFLYPFIVGLIKSTLQIPTAQPSDHPTLPGVFTISVTKTTQYTPTPKNTRTPKNTSTLEPTSTWTLTKTIPVTNTPNLGIPPMEGVFPPPDTTENIHVAQIFNSQILNPEDELGKVDLVWGSKFSSQPEGVYNLFYYPFDRDADGGKGGEHHDINWFLTNHPDWIEYTCDRTTPAYEYNDPNVPLDISNPEVLQYMMQEYIIPAIQRGYQGIAFDNVDFNNNGYRCGVWKDNEWEGQSNYIGTILDWGKWMYSHLHDQGVSIAMNFSYDFNHPSASEQIFQFIDIVVDERGFTNWGGSQGNYMSDDRWLTIMKELQNLDKSGKGFVSINQMPELFSNVSQTEKQWALSNYLLAKGGYSYIAITGLQEYGSLLTAPEYSAAIGSAINEMYQSQGVYMRDFSSGKAIVNPSSSLSFTITLTPSTYNDLYGKKVNTITLKPRSGIVLLGITSQKSP